ncbi:MAG: hypothetical protein CMB97_01435 [Flavobacteriaceae bacterium]|nr:hypothetical protein [Flavobacteriaceae bacterium]
MLVVNLYKIFILFLKLLQNFFLICYIDVYIFADESNAPQTSDKHPRKEPHQQSTKRAKYF